MPTRVLFATVLIIASALYLPPLAMHVSAQTPEESPQLDRPAPVVPLMQMKLDRAKEILEALTVEDYDRIARSARQLKLLSLESGWNVLQTEEYMTQSRDFQRATDMIVSAAQEKDIHRAALGYVSLTVRCVECHSYIRKHRAVIR